MPIPLAVGKLNKAGLNHLTRPLMRHLPGFGVVRHRGRRSGQVYETPVNVFPTADRVLIALTYGPDTDWLKNVLAAGECEIQTRGRWVHCTAPRVYRDPRRHGVRPVERVALGALGVEEFLELRRA